MCVLERKFFPVRLVSFYLFFFEQPCMWDVDSGGLREPHNGWGPDPPFKGGTFVEGVILGHAQTSAFDIVQAYLHVHSML